LCKEQQKSQKQEITGIFRGHGVAEARPVFKPADLTVSYVALGILEPQTARH
jgi:hypothetical protein